MAEVIRRIFRIPIAVCNVIGGCALVGIVAVIFIDVFLRNIFSTVLDGAIEIVGILLMPVILAGLVQVEIKRGHIQVDVLVGRFSPALQSALTAAGYFLTLIISTIITWRVFAEVLFLKNNNIVTPLLQIPEWPVVVLAGAFFSLFSLAVFANLLQALADVVQMKNRGAYWILALGIFIGAFIGVLCFQPDLIKAHFSDTTWSVLVIALLFVLIFLKMHIAAALALTSVLGIGLLANPTAGLTNLAVTTLDVVDNYTWSVVPLFTWMGLLVFFAGFAAELYKMAYRWVGHFPGGLASASTLACSGLSAIVGDTLSGVYAMGSIALPEMKAYKYDMKLATATIACAATIGMLIPPSLGFIVYGMITEVSIGKLFMAGVLPGLLLTAVMVSIITLQCKLKPALGPRGEKSSWKERIFSLKLIWPIMLLMILVLGGIYAGIVTPNEAAGIGATGTIAISLITRRMSIHSFVKSLERALELTATIMLIFVFAFAFSHFVAMTGLTDDLAAWVIGLGLGKYALISCILLFYVLLGCVMNALPAVMLTLPIFYPIAVEAGFDPVWFGVLIILTVELGVITPPIGMNVFAMSAVAKDVPMYDIFKGVVPFWGAFVVVAVILVLFPEISLWLPEQMSR